MRRRPVASTCVASIGYAAATRTLEIEFRSGRIYRYHDVTPRIVEQLVNAESIGRFMNAHIRNAFRFTRVR